MAKLSVMRLLRRPWLVAALLAACVIAGVLLARNGAGSAAGSAAQQASPVAVRRGPIALHVAATGRVVANLDVDIKCKASGQVTRVPFDVSDHVERGDLLVELDPKDEERLVRQEEAALAAAEARLVQARQNLRIAEQELATEEKRAAVILDAARVTHEDAAARAKRMQELHEQHLASQEQYDAAVTAATQAAQAYAEAQLRVEELGTRRLTLELRRADVRLSESDVAAQEVALALARQRLEDTRVLAPIDGVVASRPVQVGQIISSGISNIGGGTTVMTLSDLSHLFVLAFVDESDIGSVLDGQEAVLSVDAHPGRLFGGRVVRIATRGVSESNVVTFEVKVEVLDDARSLLKPEMTASVEILAAEREAALLVPVEAVRRTPTGYVVDVVGPGEQTAERPVALGITDGISQEITSGLSEGQVVLVRRGGGESRWRAGEETASANRARGLGSFFGRRR